MSECLQEDQEYEIEYNCYEKTQSTYCFSSEMTYKLNSKESLSRFPGTEVF